MYTWGSGAILPAAGESTRSNSHVCDSLIVRYNKVKSNGNWTAVLDVTRTVGLACCALLCILDYLYNAGCAFGCSVSGFFFH